MVSVKLGCLRSMMCSARAQCSQDGGHPLTKVVSDGAAIIQFDGSS